MRTRGIVAALAIFLGAFCARAGIIGSITPTASELVATGGEVVIYFAGQTAGFDSTLSLIAPTSVGPFFPNHATAVGTALSLGTFNAGDVLRFRMDVVNTGNQFFTGPGSGNPDGLVHVAHAGWQADATINVNGVLVGFEDLLGGGDLDFNDNTFVFTNVASPTLVPEPSTLIGVCAGLAAALMARRRSTART